MPMSVQELKKLLLYYYRNTTTKEIYCTNWVNWNILVPLKTYLQIATWIQFTAT